MTETGPERRIEVKQLPREGTARMLRMEPLDIVHKPLERKNQNVNCDKSRAVREAEIETQPLCTGGPVTVVLARESIRQVVDPGLYLAENSDFSLATSSRVSWAQAVALAKHNRLLIHRTNRPVQIAVIALIQLRLQSTTSNRSCFGELDPVAADRSSSHCLFHQRLSTSCCGVP